MNYFKDKNINNIDLKIEEMNYFKDLVDLENKYLKLYMFSNIKVYQQKRAAIRLKLFNICQKIIKD